MTDTEPPSSTEDLTSELANSLSETARTLFAEGSVVETLQRVVDLSVETIDGCDFAGIFIVEDEVVTTPVHTDPLVIEIDAVQHRSGEGPCLDAIALGGSVYAEDLIDETRWPRFGPAATALGVRSALALRLSSNGTRGALNLYARFPKAFGAEDRANGQILATLSDLALSAAESHANEERRLKLEERRLENLEAALVTRELIGQAKGILMERERITADQAFDILRRASQRFNVKLRDVAQRLVDTGEQPEFGEPGAAS